MLPVLLALHRLHLIAHLWVALCCLWKQQASCFEPLWQHQILSCCASAAGQAAVHHRRADCSCCCAEDRPKGVHHNHRCDCHNYKCDLPVVTASAKQQPGTYAVPGLWHSPVLLVTLCSTVLVCSLLP